MVENKLKETIRDAVREGIAEALIKYGVDTSDPSGMQADLLYLRSSRQSSDEVAKWVKRSAITIVISGMLVSLWNGIKQIIHGG